MAANGRCTTTRLLWCAFCLLCLKLRDGAASSQLSQTRLCWPEDSSAPQRATLRCRNPAEVINVWTVTMATCKSPGKCCDITFYNYEQCQQDYLIDVFSDRCDGLSRCVVKTKRPGIDTPGCHPDNPFAMIRYTCETPFVPRNVSKSSGRLDDKLCPKRTTITITDAWFVGACRGRPDCLVPIRQQNISYFKEIVRKCEGRQRCRDLQIQTDVRLGGGCSAHEGSHGRCEISMTVEFQCVPSPVRETSTTDMTSNAQYSLSTHETSSRMIYPSSTGEDVSIIATSTTTGVATVTTHEPDYSNSELTAPKDELHLYLGLGLGLGIPMFVLIVTTIVLTTTLIKRRRYPALSAYYGGRRPPLPPPGGTTDQHSVRVTLSRGKGAFRAADHVRSYRPLLAHTSSTPTDTKPSVNGSKSNQRVYLAVMSDTTDKDRSCEPDDNTENHVYAEIPEKNNYDVPNSCIYSKVSK